jgi:hypothetical protein
MRLTLTKIVLITFFLFVLMMIIRCLVTVFFIIFYQRPSSEWSSDEMFYSLFYAKVAPEILLFLVAFLLNKILKIQYKILILPVVIAFMLYHFFDSDIIRLFTLTNNNILNICIFLFSFGTLTFLIYKKLQACR